MRMWDVVWDQFSSSAETSAITIGYSNCLVLILGTRPVILTPTTLCTLTTT